MNRTKHSTILAAMLSLAIAPAAFGGITTFEDFGLPPNSYNNNAGAGGYFVSGGNSFNNSYTNAPIYGASWSGWAISSTTDTTTNSYTDHYSAIPGSGAGGSQIYGVAFPFSATTDPAHPADSWINLTAGTSPVSIQITNTTYAYLTMLNGDPNGFAQQFGPSDFFLLDIRGFDGQNGTGNLLGTVDFYLAQNGSIVNTWQTVDLSSLSGAASLQFGLQSSDTGVYGVNTPAYFAADNFQVATVPEPDSFALLAGCLVGLGVFCWRRNVA